MSILILLLQSSCAKKTSAEEILTETDLQIFEQFENQTIQIGYVAEYERIFMDSLLEVIQGELSVNVKFISYDSYEELKESVIKGEIDALISESIDEEKDGLYYTSAMVISNRIVVTNHDNPLYEMIKLKNSKIGFLAESKPYANFQELIGDGNVESYYFDTVEEALDALDNQEIDAFLTSESNKEALIARENLQIEFAFQDEVIDVHFATAKKEVKLFLKAVDTLLHSSRGSEIQEKLALVEYEFMKEKIRAYIQEKYQLVIEQYDTIEVGMHNAKFPYSFFETDGAAAGIYIEMLHLFDYATGIQSNIRNDLNNTNFADLMSELDNNEIKFLLGVANDGGTWERVLKVGTLEVQDNIISIKKYGNEEVDTMNLNDIRFGTVTAMKSATIQVLGEHEYEEFEDYQSALEALDKGEIDILLTRKSVLSYYKNVQGNLELAQTDLINNMSTHGILGNEDNEGLNSIMAEIQRLYSILHTEDQEIEWSNQVIDYQRKYAQLQEQQDVTNQLFIALGVGGIAIIVGNIIWRKGKENKRLKRENEVDRLTGVYNRYTYQGKCLDLIKKHPNKLGIFFFIDLNNFKHFNDTYGHAIGDEVLIQFGRALRSLEDKKTIAFRIGGDEFGLFRMGLHSRIEIVQVIQEIQMKMQCEVVVDSGEVIPIRFSAGGSVYNLDTTDFDTLIKYADFAMYRAKKRKEELCAMELFDKDKYQGSQESSSSSSAVDMVLKEKQIYAVYQPICCLENGKVYGYEGLSRTRNPAFSNILELIAAADKENKIRELDLLMMEQVIRDFNGEEKLFVNAEGKSIEAITEYVEKMVQTAKEVGLPTENIVLELSERKKWEQQCLFKIRELAKRDKFLLAVDDFGVGFSEISLLSELRPDIVKIDRSFIQEIHKDKQKYEYIKTFLEFARENKMRIVCEGIEEKEELEVLKDLGSDYGQGYYLGKPE